MNQADSVPPRVLTKSCLTCGTGYTGEVAVCPDDGTVLTPVSEDVLIGTTIAGRYQILSFIGRGGMSVVYKARHLYMERVQAVKMLHAHLVSNAQSLKRFQQEAQAASHLAHPHIMGVHDFGISPQGQPYLVMDYLQGSSLAEVIERERQLSVERAINIFAQACDALAHAHQKGVVHRDLKPSNIMLIDTEEQPDFVKIVDFGIAKLLPQSEKQGQHLTQTGEVFGSPLYMSPEQCLAGNLDARSDIYSLGCVIYEAVTGKAPLTGGNMLETMYMHLNEPPLPFAKVRPDLDLPDELEAVVFKSMEKDPKNRQQSMTELKEELEKVPLATRSRRGFLRALGRGPARRGRAPWMHVRLSARQLVVMACAFVLAGGLIVYNLLGFGRAPAGASAYGPDSFWQSYEEQQEAPENQIKAAQDEGLLKLMHMLKQKAFGDNDPQTVELEYKLAKFYQKQGKYAEALKWYRGVYNALKSGVASDKVDPDEVSKELAEMYRREGDYEDAEQVATEALRGFRPGSVQPELPVLLMTLADSCFHEGKLDEAERALAGAVLFWTPAKEDQDRLTGIVPVPTNVEGGVLPDKSAAALALMDLAEVRRAEKKPGEAVKAYRLAEQFKEELLGQDQAQLPRSLLTLAWLYEQAGDYADAEPLYKRAWSLSEKARGGRNPEVAIILNRYADLLWRSNRWIEAIIFKVRAQLTRA